MSIKAGLLIGKRDVEQITETDKIIENREWYQEQYGHELEDWIISDDIDRMQAANAGYKLDQLMFDPETEVRRAVAKLGYRPDHFINDPDDWVRFEVAQLNYRLDILFSDHSADVREGVAKIETNFLRLQALSEDSDINVKEAALLNLQQHPDIEAKHQKEVLLSQENDLDISTGHSL